MIANEALSALRSVYQEWAGFLSNPRSVRLGSDVSWEGYKPKEFIDVVTASFVSDLAENGQYSFQVTQDGSIFQLHYGYDRRGQTLTSASLSFLFSGNNYLEEAKKELIDELLMPTPDVEVGWLRIDYSNAPMHDGGVIHPKCHLHLSHFPDTRLIVDRVPNPKQFVEFVVSVCYPGIYKEKRLDTTGYHTDKPKMCNINTPLLFDLNMTEICTYSPYLRIPSATVAPMLTTAQPRRRR